MVRIQRIATHWFATSNEPISSSIFHSIFEFLPIRLLSTAKEWVAGVVRHAVVITYGHTTQRSVAVTVGDRRHHRQIASNRRFRATPHDYSQ
jgi:hypothetical protein